jgi:hypothetical protein
MPLGDAIGQLKKGIDPHNDEDIKHDIILLWAEQRRIITGSDILGRLLHGINIQPA